MKHSNGFIIRLSLTIVDDREAGRLPDFKFHREEVVAPGNNLSFRLGAFVAKAIGDANGNLGVGHLAARIDQVEKGGAVP